MRYPASEKLESEAKKPLGLSPKGATNQLVEQSHLSVKRTLSKLGIPSTTLYRWYDRYRTGGPEALEDRRPSPGRV